MKQIYKFLLIFAGLTLFGINSYSQEFTHKENLKVDRMRSSSDYKRTVKFTDLFNFPAEIDIKSELSTNADITINFSSTNESNLFFDGYYYSTWSGQYFYYKIPANSYGEDTLTITLTYNGVDAISKVITNIDPIECSDDSYDLDIGDTLEVTVTQNDNPRTFLDYSSFEIIQSATSGTHQITGDGTIKYYSDKNTPNYTSDKLIYRIADIDANYDTAVVYMNVHKNSYASKIFDFLPGPGQFVNTSWADTAAAKKVIGNTSGGVSLGGFGGYIIVGFDQPIVNRANNPYGVDFTVVGNAFGGWGEPAAVQVMKDVNKNGLPDDTWYELAGSEYYFQSSIKDLTMTYYNPEYNDRHTITYSTDKGFNGAMRTNGFHKQQYYPDPYSFEISPDSVSYNGTFTRFLLDKSKPNYIVAKRLPAFGYADSRPANRYPTNPMNPYFEDENGKAADGFDLEWAVDIYGNQVSLDTVHFVKVYSTVQEDGGWLGEISPEIFKVAITTPNPDYVPKNYEFHAIGAAQLQVLKGTSLQYEGLLFKNGIPQSGTPQWSSDSTHVAIIDNTGLLTAIENGQTTIHFSAKSSVPEDSLIIEVVELTDVIIELEGNSNVSNDTIRVIKGETEYIHAEAIDNRPGDRNRFVYETFNWVSSDSNVGTIHNGIFKAKNTGTTNIIAQSAHSPELKDTIIAIVTDIPDVTAINDTINIPYYSRSGSFENNELFQTGVDAIVHLKSINFSANIIHAEINSNKLEYSVKENLYGTENIEFTVEAFGIEKTINLVFKAVEPDNYNSPKQILFTNGGEFMNPNAPTELMTYIPEQDTTIQIDNYLAGATSVQDMIIDGNYAYVSADYYITRYNVSSRTATDSIYTQDLDPNSADGQGTDMAGVNHKLAIYKNMLLATRQNSAQAPEDGYNVRIYNKGDLSFIKKIPVSDQATDIVIVNDTAYVMINGGFAGQTSSLAIIDLKTLTLDKEVDLGIAGLGVMQMIAKENKIYCVRLADFMGRFNSGVVIYDIDSCTIQEVEYTSGIPYDSSPLAIEPCTNDTIFIKKDLGYVAFNTQDQSFGSETHMNIPSYYTQDSDHIGRGSAYDPDEKKYYVAYAYWHGEGVGQIYNSNLDSIGSFKGVGASPEVMKICQASVMNEKPYTYSTNSLKTYNEGEDFKFRLSYSTFKDKEDNYPAMYLYNPAQYDWLSFDSQTRYISGNYNAELTEPTTFNILMQGIDKQGAFVLDTVKITINPVDDPMTIGTLIPDISVDEDAADSVLTLTETFVDVDNPISTSIISNTNPSLITTTISNNVLTIHFNEEQNGEAEVIIEAESNDVTLTDTFNVYVTPVDDAPYVANSIADITANENESIAAIDLSNVFDDIDNDNSAITKEIISVIDETLLTMSITNNLLTIELKENQSGKLEVIIEATSNTLTVTDTFNINVKATDNAPTVANPIADITANEDENIADIDLTNVFDDIDNDNTAITKVVKSISNTNLLNAEINSNNLSLALLENQFGESEVVVEATSNGLSVTDTFNLVVNAVNDQPVVVETIDDITVDMNAANKQIDLSNLFDDIDGDKLEITVSSNTNESLVETSISENMLNLSFVQDQYGTAELTVTASDGTESVNTSFNITVNNTATGFDDIEKITLKIYPNPVQDIINIDCEFGMERIVIYNSIGNIQRIINPENINYCKINVSGLPSGTYFISIKGNNKQITKTIIKQ